MLPADAADSDKFRAEYPHPESAYGFLSYLTYCLYTPLYLAGPIVTFNLFYSQVRAGLGCGYLFSHSIFRSFINLQIDPVPFLS